MLDFDRLITPFWEGNKVYDESVMLLSETGGIAKAPLFYTPCEILSVKSADLLTEYKEGTDWELKDGNIVRVEGSSIPFMNKEECHFYEKTHEDCFDAKDGGYILYKTKGYFHKRQLVVSYTHNDSFDFGVEKAEQMAEEYTNRAIESLDVFEDSSELCDLAKKLMGRKA